MGYIIKNDGTILKKKKKEEKNKVLTIKPFTYSDNNTNNFITEDSFERKSPKSYFDNGYQFGDITKTGLKTVGNIATNVTHGAVKSLENFYDFTENASSNINTRLNEWLGIQTKEEAAKEREKAQEIIKRDLTTEAENALGWDEKLRTEWERGSLVRRDNIGGQVSQAVGEMLPTLIVGNAVGAVPSNATKVQKLISTIPTTQTLGVSSYGGALEQAYNEGATTSQANKYALGSALTEVATEWLTGGVPGVNDKGILDSLEEKTLNKVSNNLARFIIKEGYNVVGEGAEEALSEIINPILKNATYSQGEKVNWNDVIRSAIVGGITGGILDLPGNISTYKSNANIQQQNQGNLSENTQSSINLPPQQENPLAKLQRTNAQQRQQINQQVEQELATRRNGINQELSLPTVSTEGMNLMESASRYNIKPETQSAVQNLMENRGIESRWDATKFSDNSVNALWTKDANGNRQVIFNPNASLDTIVEEVAVHELTHDILSSKNTTLNSKEVLNYVKTLQGYNEARQSLENTYATMYDPNSTEFNSLIDEEVVADVLGRKLGNQEFINQLVNSKPSVAKSIYNWVVNKLNSIVNKGKVRSEKLYWQNIKNNFENAYKQEYKNIDNTNPTSNPNIRYSLSTNKDNLGAIHNLNNIEGYEVQEDYYPYDNVIGHSFGLKTKEGTAHLQIRETANEVYLNMINTRLGNSTVEKGAGTKILNNLKEYSDKTGKRLVIAGEVGSAKGFYDKFDWLKSTKGEIYDDDGNLFDISSPNRIYEPSTSTTVKYSLTKDSQGRTLSKQQQEYFKDSKVRDDEGRLLEVYHGTPNGDFNIFDRNKLGETTLSTDSKLGFHFTENKEFAELYSNGEIGIARDNFDSTIKKVYLNIKKPFDLRILGDYIENGRVLTQDDIKFIKDFAKIYSDEKLNTIEDIEDYFDDFYDFDTDRIKDALDINKLKKMGYDGVINYIQSNDMGVLQEEGIENYGYEYIAFEPNQIKNVDNTNPTVNEDIRYSKENAEWNEFLDKNITKDNQGNEVAPGMQKYMSDSRARVDEDINKPLVRVYHTTTDKVAQFNEFNPTGTDYYKFGDQVVNYYTDDKNMSGSYADQHYKMADTRKLNSIEDVNNYLKEFNESFNTLENPSGNAAYVVREENGKYNIYNEVEKDIINSANDFINTLNAEEKEFIKKYLQDGASKVLFEDRYGLTSEQENYIKKYEDWAFNQYSPKSLSHAPQNYLAMLLMDTYTGRPVATYDSKDKLFRNLKTDLEIDNYDKRNKLQYAGYVNITKPYIIDAEGRTWNKVESKADSDITKELLKVNNEDRQYLERLASDSIKTYNDNLFNYQQAERAVNDFAVDRTNTTLEQRLIHRTIHDLGFEDFMKVLNNDKNVYWGRKEQFMDDAFNNGFATYKQRQDFNKSGNIPVEVLEKIDKLIHEPVKYEDRYLRKELEAMGMPPEIKETTIYDLWNNQDKAYKTFDEGGRYEYSKFNNQVNEKNLYRAIDNEILFKVAKKGFNDDNIRLLYNDWSVTNDIVKSIIELNKVGENYDGLIIKNVVDYGGDSETHEPHNLYITFASNQFKAADNENPTSDPDIRYSKQSEEWDKWNNRTIAQEGTKTKLGDIKLPTRQKVSLPTKSTTEAKTSPTEPKKPSSKDVETKIQEKVERQTQNKGIETLKKATNAGKNYLQLKQSEVKQLKEDLKQYAGKTKEQLTNSKTYNSIKDTVRQFMEKEVEHLDYDMKQVKNQIKNTNIKVDSNLKNQITDYNYFRKSNFGKLKLGNTGQSIDSVYQELSGMYPYYFNPEIDTEADMLYEISDFMNKSDKTIEKYNLTDSELDRATDKIFNSLIDNSLSNEDIENIQNELANRYSKRTRKVVQEELLDEMGITENDISVGKDINAIDFQRTDPIRLNEKVFGAETGRKINEATISRTKHNEAERTRFLNKERKEIKDLGIKPRSKESAAVQKYGEKQYLNDNNELVPYGDKELASEFKDVATQNKIKRAAQVLRNKYDIYIDQINDVITNMGYDAIPKRQDYMRHFQEINDKLSKWGVPLNPTNMNENNIPTDINGLTDQFKPGKNWFASAMQRKGLKTTYDAITGIDGYLEGASNLIYHTEDIQRYRALSKLIRDTYGQTHGMDNIDPSTEEGQKRLNDIFDNKLSKYAAWLDEQANALAGKKGGIDRAAERVLGRKIYSVLDAAKKQVGSNMTGFNVRSALTNFASAVQGVSKTNKLAFLKGTISTMKNIIHDDGLINKSDFLTSRFGSDQLSKKAWQKASNAGQIFMTGTDYFTANQIWRGKYYENLSKGMSEKQAIKNADDFASRVMGDRSKGATAEIFNSKTLGLLTQFQLEVNNQWSSIMHDNKMDIKTGNKSGATVMFQLGQLAALSYLFNNMMKSLTGSDVMIDPIDMLKKIIGDDDDKDKTMEDRAKEVMGDLINDIPFASFMTGGRIPMSEAFKGAESLFKYATGQKDKYGNNIKVSDVKKDLIESGFYWLLPTGYGQAKKTIKGISMYDKKLPVAGSYTDSGNLRFNADESTGGKVKAALFGQYSSKESQKYIDSGYKAISKSRLDELKDLGMSASQYRKYREGLNNAGTTNADKIEYIANSNYSDVQKDIMAKNILGRDFDIDKYNKYNSYEEYDYATKYPEKYTTIKQIAPYDKYTKYKDEITNIRNNTTNDKVETIKYINSLNMNVPQKAMFIKQYYKSFKQYDKQIAEYIAKQPITKKEKEQILTQLGFTIKDGRVYY